MSAKAGTDIGVGRAYLWTRIRLTLEAIRTCVYFGFIPGFLIPLTLWFWYCTPESFDVVKLNILAKFLSPNKATLWFIRTESGAGLLSVLNDRTLWVQHINPNDAVILINRLSSAWADFIVRFKWSLFIGFLCFSIVLMWESYAGRISRLKIYLRGAADILSAKQLNRLVRKRRQKSKFSLVGVWLPIGALVRGVLIEGANGSGKSVATNDLMQQVFKSGCKTIIHDSSGEYFRLHYRPGKDFFFNPTMKGSVPWSIFTELNRSYDADELARAFLPPKQGHKSASGSNAFFEDAARALFSVILLRLREMGAVNTCDIARVFFEMPDAEMDELIKKTVASSAVGGDSKGQRQGVISSIAIYLNGIAAVNEGSWCFSEWLNAKDDSRFFLLGSEDTHAMISPLFRLILSVGFTAIAAKQEIVHEPRYVFFLDELNKLGDINVDNVATTMRKYGVCLVPTVQSSAQVVDMLGPERGHTTLNCLNTSLLLSANDDKMQKAAAERLGRREVSIAGSNQALAVVEARDAAGLTRSQHEEWLVMPSEFGSLDPCQGYLKLPGSYPVAKVDYSSWVTPSLFWTLVGLERLAPTRVNRYQPSATLPVRDSRFAVLPYDIDAETGEVIPKSFEVISTMIKDVLKEAPKSPYAAQEGSSATADGGKDGQAVVKENVQELESSPLSEPNAQVSVLKDTKPENNATRVDTGMRWGERALFDAGRRQD